MTLIAPQERDPDSVGFIIDGNRRWARTHGLPSLEGHRRGYEKVKEVARWCKRRGIRYMTVYAFSTENWKRQPDEVKYLMDLNRLVLSQDVPELLREGVRVRIIGGRTDPLPEDLAALMERAEATTAQAGELLLQIAINYGGRADLVHAIQDIIRAGIPADQIDEAVVTKHLWTVGVPDPDLIIRTSGEQRLSGFLTWESVYSELYFSRTLWPDFSEAEFESILDEYAHRDRRIGK
ncbi:MAG: polyprenyl diphosphate synthase [Patescibacteria group bacterium]|nr:polyprenyl diphosphate synthase [Patescibacteria group bacterium]